MLRIWATITTVANTALGVAGLGIIGYAVSVQPPMILFYYGVAFICLFGSIVGFLNMGFVSQAVRRSEEKNRSVREERERKKAERAAKKAEKEAARAAAKAQQEAEAEAARAQQEAEAQAAGALLEQEEAPIEEPELAESAEPVVSDEEVTSIAGDGESQG